MINFSSQKRMHTHVYICVVHVYYMLFNVKYFVQVCKGLCPWIRDPPKYPEKILFCGWRRDIDDMIMVIL